MLASPLLWGLALGIRHVGEGGARALAVFLAVGAIYVATLLPGLGGTEEEVAARVEATVAEHLPELADDTHHVVGLDALLEAATQQLATVLDVAAEQGLFGTAEGITRIRGRWRLYQGRIAVMPTFHPAYLLTRGDNNGELVLRVEKRPALFEGVYRIEQKAAASDEEQRLGSLDDHGKSDGTGRFLGLFDLRNVMTIRNKAIAGFSGTPGTNAAS